MAGNKPPFNPEDPAQREAANAANRERLKAEHAQKAREAASAPPPAAPPTPSIKERAGTMLDNLMTSLKEGVGLPTIDKMTPEQATQVRSTLTNITNNGCMTTGDRAGATTYSNLTRDAKEQALTEAGADRVQVNRVITSGTSCAKP